jgi:hypothetical protein
MREEGKYPIPENLPEGAKIIYPEKGGMIIHANGHIYKGSVIATAIHTPEEGRRRAQIRIDATKKKVRDEIVEVAKERYAEMRATGKLRGGRKVEHASDVFAVAAGMLFDDVVLNQKAYPRDRLSTFKELGKLSEVLEDESKPPVTQSLPNSLLDNANRIVLAIEYAKANPQEISANSISANSISASRDAEVIDVEPRTPKKWI